MSDWRLKNPPTFLEHNSIRKIIFPDFWEESYKEKNKFYKMIKLESEEFVIKYGRGEEYLIGNKIQDFWHEHCIFCTDKITTRDNRKCFCTMDYKTWICQSCYQDFNQLFHLNLIN